MKKKKRKENLISEKQQLFEHRKTENPFNLTTLLKFSVV